MLIKAQRLMTTCYRNHSTAKSSHRVSRRALRLRKRFKDHLSRRDFKISNLTMWFLFSKSQRPKSSVTRWYMPTHKVHKFNKLEKKDEAIWAMIYFKKKNILNSIEVVYFRFNKFIWQNVFNLSISNVNLVFLNQA